MTGAGLAPHRVALVSGGTSGIGAEIARALASAGATVVIGGRDERRGNQVVGELERIGAQAMLVTGDLSDPNGPADVAAQALELAGRIDVLVNNAGTFMGGPLESVDPTTFDWAFALNVRSAFLLTQALVPGMVERGWGRVIATSTGAAQIGLPGAALYGATKAALDQLIRAWAVEYAAHGVTFNSIAAGFVETPLSAEGLGDPAARQAIESTIPAGRIGRPADIAAAAVYLAGESADYVQGNALRVDGGLVVA